MPRDTNELETPDNEDDVTFEKDFDFLRDFPNFTALKKDIRALAAVRSKLNLARYENLNVFVLMHGTDRDVSADRVFARDDKNNVIFFSKRGSIKKSLEARGHEARKANLERSAESERADIFIALDPNLNVTKQLRENIAPGAFVVCRLHAANALRPYGYRFKAIISMGSGTPSLSRHNDPTFWKSVQVNSEKAFREASEKKNEGVVTYEEAQQKVKEAREVGVPGMSEDNVFESYSKLIEMAEDQNPSAEARGDTMLSITVPIEEKEVTIANINTVLPTKKSEHDDDIIVMRKGLM